MKKSLLKNLPNILTIVFILVLCFGIGWAILQWMGALGGLVFGGILLVIVLGASKEFTDNAKKNNKK